MRNQRPHPAFAMPRSLLSSYPKNTERFDEMLAGDGALRPSWQAFDDHLCAATSEQMRRRLDYVRRRIQESGVTYNVYVLSDTQHITLAGGRDFGDVSPLRGVILGGDAHELDVAVTVTPCTAD